MYRFHVTEAKKQTQTANLHELVATLPLLPPL